VEPPPAAHLLRRAGFGGSPADVDRFAVDVAAGAVDALIRFPDTGALAPPRCSRIRRSHPAARMYRGFAGRHGRRSGEVADTRKAFQMENNRIAPREPHRDADVVARPDDRDAGAAAREDDAVLARPLHQRRRRARPRKSWSMQNNLFRAYALGNIREFTLHVAQDPAMLRYLDNNVNVKAHPNENFARELMELFTLGIGNYTERTCANRRARSPAGRSDTRLRHRIFPTRRHDDGTKTFLGQTGNFTGHDIVEIIFTQPAAARFAAKLLAFFVYSDPEPQLVDQVAALLRKNDFEPAAGDVDRAAQQRVLQRPRLSRAGQEPGEFVVGSYQLFGVKEVRQLALGALRRWDRSCSIRPTSRAGTAAPRGSTARRADARELRQRRRAEPGDGKTRPGSHGRCGRWIPTKLRAR
jgi:hypothetical protein